MSKKTTKKTKKSPNKTKEKYELTKAQEKTIQTHALMTIKQLKSIADSTEIIPEQYIKEIKKELKPLIKEAQERIKEEYTTGRPTKYNPNMCYKVIDYMSKGLSKEDVSILLGVSYVHFLEWVGKFPEFGKSINLGVKLSEYWWKEQGRLNLYNKNFNSTLYMMNMQNRYGWTRRLDGKIDIKEEHINTEKKVLEVKISNKDEDKAKVLKILHESGALEIEKDEK